MHSPKSKISKKYTQESSLVQEVGHQPNYVCIENKILKRMVVDEINVMKGIT